jgi:hydroxymethylpyrimidine/phosphomethylpyrimidine kinase
MSNLKRALTIAGSDSGGGAGIQADLKTFGALGVYGASVLTALTAQNTLGVQAVFEAPPQFVTAQIDSVLGDIGADAVKTGMLSNAAIIEAVAEGIRRHAVPALVVDPVMVAKSGDPLLREDACSTLIERLLPLATVVTPNLPEAGVLTGLGIARLDDMREAARRIHALGPAWVVVKGGHLSQAGDVVDLLFDGQTFHEYRSPRLETRNTHGTGCTFASAIAAGLAKGLPVVEAVAQAKAYLASVLHASVGLHLGDGPHGPMHHFMV